MPPGPEDAWEPDRAERDAAPDAPGRTTLSCADFEPGALALTPRHESPAGWWGGGFWGARTTLKVQRSWPGELTLPVRVPGALSERDGQDLCVVIEGADGTAQLLTHEIERWSPFTENVLWVRFTRGLESGAKLRVYASLDERLGAMTSSPDETWRGLARHVYHFDGDDDEIEFDRLKSDPIHFAKSANAAYQQLVPDDEMGRRLGVASTQPELATLGARSPLHVPAGRDTTFELYWRLGDDPGVTGKSFGLSDENKCFGNSFFFNRHNYIVVHARGEACSPEPKREQTVNHYANPEPEADMGLSGPENRLYANESHLLHVRFDWARAKRNTLVHRAPVPGSGWAPRRNDSGEVPLESLQGERAPQTLIVGGVPYDGALRSSVTIDTLIVHDRLLSAEEIALRALALFSNAEVFLSAQPIERLD